MQRRRANHSSSKVIAVFALFPAIAHSWGETGHRAVCQIAFDELTEVARVEVERLLSLDPELDDFAESCLYADIPERIRLFDHFMNVPRSFSEITTAVCPLADTCLIPAIDSDVAVLQDPESSDDDKLLALKLLGHWIGDIHQPLHVSYQDDRGANNITVDIDLSEANLHGVWDYQIVTRNLGDDYLQIAADLRATISDQQRVAWNRDSAIQWANESYQITTSPSVDYCTRKQGACWYSEDNMLLDADEPWRLMSVSDHYLEMHGPIVSKRLRQAGVRLAELLNQAFDATP